MVVSYFCFRQKYIVICLTACLGIAHVSPEAGAAADKDIEVRVKKAGSVVIADADLLVPVTPQLAWQVLTDYENMPAFLPGLQTSKVIERSSNRLRVSQSGAIGYGLLSVPFDYVRDVELMPITALRSTVVGGSLKSGTVLTRLAAEGAATRITYHSEAVPNIWVPLGLSEAVIRYHISQQLEGMRTEMLRRKSIQ